jgi:transcriptional regulator with XRE-family HTH domain
MSRANVQAFGRAVERHRTRQGLTREEVAKRSGDRGSGALTGGYIKFVENTGRPVSLHMNTSSLYSAFQTAKGLGITPSELVEGIEDEVAP